MSSLVYTINTWDIRDLTNTGSTLTINGNVAVLGSQIFSDDVLIATAATGKQFYWSTADNRNSIFMNIGGGSGDVNQYFELSENGAVATLKVKALGAGQNVNWITVQVRDTVAPDNRYYTITQADIDNMKANNVSGVKGGVNVITGMPVYSTDSITFTATNSAKFTKTNYNPNYFVAWGKFDNSYVEATSNSPYTTATQTMSSAFNSVTGAGQIARLLITTTTGAVSTDGSIYDLTNADVAQMVTNGVTLTQNGLDANKLYTKIYKGAAMVATADGLREFVDTKVYFGAGILGSVDTYYNFVIGTGRQVATLTMPATLKSGESMVLLNTETQQHVPDVVGSNKVYSITNSILADVNKQRFNENLTDGSIFDYGAYILSVLELPFIIDPSMIIAAEPIQLADKKLTTSAPVIIDDVIVLDLGEITVAGDFGDLRDYVNTAAILHLPRIQPVSVDLEYVINQTIHIVYYLDVYTGQATVNIKSTKTNENIMTRQVNLGVQVPMANKQDNVAENTAVEVGGDNDVYKPFIEIVRNPAILANGSFTIPIVDENTLNTASGFIRVDEMELKTKALNAEASEIVTKLSNGVIIK